MVVYNTVMLRDW